MTTPGHSGRDHVNAQKGRVQRIVLPLISLCLFSIASGAIYYILKEISFTQLIAELTRLSTVQLALAALFTLGSYAALSGYDWSALSYLGRQLPYRTVALAAFCGCAIANTVGLNILSGGSVRYRFYVPFGLGSLAVVSITLFAMVAYGIGISVVAAVALIIDPKLVAGLFGASPSVLRNIGTFILIVFAGLVTLTFLKKTPIRLGRWQLQLPTAGITLAQFVFSVLEILFAGGCLYVLIAAPDLPFLGFLVVYSVGVVAGMVSYVPGGLGVFEGFMLLTFRHSLPAESLAAALLLYRAIYYLAPLMLAAVILAARELIERISLPEIFAK